MLSRYNAGLLFCLTLSVSFFVRAADWQHTEISVLGQSPDIAYADEKQVLFNIEQAEFELNGRVLLHDINTMAAVIFRRGKEQQHYLAGISAQDNNAFLSSDMQSISNKGMRVKAGTWFYIRLRVRNNHFVMWVDDKPVSEGDYPVFDAIDNAYTAGTMGLLSEGNATWQDVKISHLSTQSNQVTYTNPVQLNCADPGMLFYQQTYYAYCTYTANSPLPTQGIRLYTSTDLVHWQDRGFALKDEHAWGTKGFWAPDVVAKDGKFYMYFAANERMVVAEADSPLGPFTQQTQAPMLPDSIKIDGHVFIDDDGKQYFYYVGFDNGNHIWGAELNHDMKTVREDTIRHMIAPQEPWETHMAPIAEGPMVIKHKGLYYMTYSGSHFQSPNYSVGYAIASHPMGPWKKYAFNPVMKSTPFAHGTAHHTLTTSPDGQEMFIVYHQHYSANQTEPRKISIDRIRFVEQPDGPDILEVWGPTVTPQPMPSGTSEH